MWYVVTFVAGIFTGWWFFPQPQWARDLYARLAEYFDGDN